MNREDVEKVHEINAELSGLKEKASDLLKAAKDRSGKRKATLLRHGKQVMVEENLLWQEVFHLGADCEAGKKLKESHPEVFKAYEEVEGKAAELKAHVRGKLGVDFTAMTISDYLKLTEGMVGLMLGERRK